MECRKRDATEGPRVGVGGSAPTPAPGPELAASATRAAVRAPQSRSASRTPSVRLSCPRADPFPSRKEELRREAARYFRNPDGMARTPGFLSLLVLYLCPVLEGRVPDESCTEKVSCPWKSRVSSAATFLLGHAHPDAYDSFSLPCLPSSQTSPAGLNTRANAWVVRGCRVLRRPFFSAVTHWL